MELLNETKIKNEVSERLNLLEAVLLSENALSEKKVKSKLLRLFTYSAVNLKDRKEIIGREISHVGAVNRVNDWEKEGQQDRAEAWLKKLAEIKSELEILYIKHDIEPLFGIRLTFTKQEIPKQELLRKLREYAELLSEHYLRLEKDKSEGENDNRMLLRVIKNVEKLIVQNCSKLVNLEKNEEWRDKVINELEEEKEVWKAIEKSFDISEFKNLVGIQKFNELLKN